MATVWCKGLGGLHRRSTEKDLISSSGRKKMKRINWTVAALVSASMLASGYTGMAQAADPLKIGASLPLTGGFSIAGQKHQQGYELCVDLINERGGIMVARSSCLFPITDPTRQLPSTSTNASSMSTAWRRCTEPFPRVCPSLSPAFWQRTTWFTRCRPVAPAHLYAGSQEHLLFPAECRRICRRFPCRHHQGPDPRG